MREDEPTYFTGADARLLLLTHPDEKWRGHEIDCAYFQLTAGTTPVHLWNYARRDGPTMSEATATELADLQSGQSGGAPFDDTAVGNLTVSLQLVLNEQRFEDTYYKMRSMSEIGNVLIEYSKLASFEDTSEAGYTLLDGRVQQVGREVRVDNTVNPSVQIQFRNVRPLGEPVTYSSTPSDTRGGPALSPALQATGLGGDGDKRALQYQTYSARLGGKKAKPEIIRESEGADWPTSIEGFNQREAGREQFDATAKEPKAWLEEQGFIGPIVETRLKGKTQTWFWSGELYRPAEATGPIDPASEPGGPQTSKDLLGVIKQFEDHRENWYTDSAGYSTIGYGMTARRLKSLGIAGTANLFIRSETGGGLVPDTDAAVSKSESEGHLKTDLNDRIPEVKAALDREPTDHQLDAMISLAYNIGSDALASSTLVDKFNSGDIQAAADEFLEWKKTGVEVEEGLVKRRKDERAIFLSGDYTLSHSYPNTA